MGVFLDTIRPARRGWLLLPITVLLAVCVLARVDEMPVGAATDDAHYVEMARSLAEGRGAVLHVGPESTPADTVFPPGLPILLAPLAGLFPASLAALKIVPLLTVLLVVPLCLAWPDGGGAPRLRLALAAVVVLNPWVVAQAGRILSDLPFTVVSLAAGAACVRSADRPADGPLRWLALGALAGAAILIRTVGLALLVTMFVHLLTLRRPGRAVLLAVGAAVVVVVPVLLDLSPAVLPLGRVYGAQFLGHHADPGARIVFMAGNLVGYLDELPALVVPVFGKAVAALGSGQMWGKFLVFARTFTAYAVAGGVLAGLVTAWRRGDAAARSGPRFWATYVAVYGLVLLNFDGYPSGVQLRLLLPVLPILAWYLLVAADAWRPRRTAAPLTLLLVVMLGASLGHNAWRIAHPLRRATDAAGRGFVDPGVGARWVREHTEPADVLLAQAPLERHIHVRRPVVGMGDLAAAALTERVVRNQVALVLVGPHANGLPRRLDADGEALLALLRAAPARYPLVHEVAGQAVALFGVADADGRCRWIRPEPLSER